MEDKTSATSFSPSFRYYSSDQLARFAPIVGDATTMASLDEIDEEEQEELEFEFTPARTSRDSFPSFPLFKADLLLDRSWNLDFRDAPDKSLALQELFVEEEWDVSSSSSSDAEELERVEPEPYSEQKPNSPPSPVRCEKSKSTGSSGKHRRFRLRKFLQRSFSDGSKYSLRRWGTSKKKEEKEKADSGNVTALTKGKAKEKQQTASVTATTTAHEQFYLRSRALKEEDKRRSYLPYRQDLFSFFVNVNGLAKKIPPF